MHPAAHARRRFLVEEMSPVATMCWSDIAMLFRIIHAKYGADAIFIESQSESGGWRFKGASGGSFSELRFRAKAIVWK